MIRREADEKVRVILGLHVKGNIVTSGNKEFYMRINVLNDNVKLMTRYYIYIELYLIL